VTSLATDLKAQEDRLLPCVHCGFCLPACPTYVRLGDENDSPRGRLYLMRAVVEGRLSASSDAFQTHIDRCLGCRACEPVCPSGVEYGLLLESARDAAYQARRPGLSVRVLLSVFRRGLLLRWSMVLARMTRGLGLAWLGSRVTPRGPSLHPVRFGLAMLEATRRKRLPAIASVESLSAASILTDEPDALRDMPLSEAGPVEGLLDGSTHTAVGPLTDEAAADAASEAAAVADRPLRVALLTGCVQAGLFARVNDATERVLRANGFEIVQVSGQQCCGALHAHAGDTDSARRLARVNIDVLLKSKADFVAVNAAGCGSALKEYGHLLRDDAKYSEAAAKLSPISRDVSELLAEAGVRRGASVPRRVTYDAACHLCHAQRLREAPRAMLEAIPDLDLLPLQGEDDCCGGAGIYGMTHPELGEQIGSDKVSAVIDTGADVVATANPGCIMQIGAGLMLRGSQIRALHPVELLDESYERAGFYR